MARLIHRRAGGVVAWFALTLIAGTTIGVSPVAAADPVTFGTPTATSTFGKGIEFQQPLTTGVKPKRVELLITTPGAIGPEVVTSPPGGVGISTLIYTLDTSDGHVGPNTTFTARFRVVDETGKAWLGPAVRQTYVDDRFEWQTLTGAVVRVHWYQGDQAFGLKALKIGDDAVTATAELLGVDETDPIDFFIYADQQPFYDALGPGTRENVGGQAHPDIRTLFALIAPEDINAGWIESVVPHELTHVVFATAIDNPYHEPPHWLNEGLAVYLSDGYDDSHRALVASAVKEGSIIPLDGLAGAFPTTRARFFLAYAESVSAVDRIVRVDGRDALVKLIRTYHDGVSDDEAFQAALGTDLAGFEADWLANIGAASPTRLGPQPAPAGPLPAGWGSLQSNPGTSIGDNAGIQGWLGVLSIAGSVVLVLTFGLGLRRMQRNAARFSGAAIPRPPQASPSPGVPRPQSRLPPSESWTASDWSLPRDVDPPDDDLPDDPNPPAGPPNPPADR